MFVSICLWIFLVCKTYSQTTQSPFDNNAQEHELITEDLLRIYSNSQVTYHSLWNRVGFNGHDQDDNRRRDIIDDWDIFPPITVHFLYCDITALQTCTEDNFEFKVTIDVEKYAPSGNISQWEFGKCGFSKASGTVSQCSFVDSNIIIAGNFEIDHSGDHFRLKDNNGNVYEADYFVLAAVYNQTVCPCDCIYHEKVETAKNKTRQKKSMDELKAELGPQLQKMKKNLTVDTSTLSAFINRKVSKGDERKSSKQIGVIGIVFLAVELLMVVAVDMISVVQRWSCFKRIGIQH